jgi:signal transduction histidine kinase
LETLSRRVIETQEFERFRLARDVHDELGQLLTALKFELASLRNANDPSLCATVDRIQERINLAIAGVRDWSMKLRPPMLDDLGLLPALIWLIKRNQEDFPMTFQLRHQNLEARRFPKTIELTAYRVVQEALTNVVRHAKVSEAMVHVWFQNGTLGLIVSDQGVGFDVERSELSGESCGLTGIRERVRWLQGRCQIVSDASCGTKLTIELPCVESTSSLT